MIECKAGNIGRSNENGFTIIEVIVAINLSFLVMTFIVSFFLFTFRLTSSIQKKIEMNHDFNNILFRLEERLRRADEFYLHPSEGNLLLIIDKRDSITFSDSLLNFSNIFVIDSFEKLETEIITDDETITYSFTNSDEQSMDFHSEEIIFSEMIRSIKFSLTGMNKVFHSEYIRGQNSATGFRNIR